MEGRKQIDKAKEQRAWTAATLRLVVAGYIAYLGYKIATAEDTTMSHTTAMIFGVVFGVAAAAILGYIVYRLRIDLAEARIKEEPEAPSAEPEAASQDDDGGK